MREGEREEGAVVGQGKSRLCDVGRRTGKRLTLYDYVFFLTGCVCPKKHRKKEKELN